MEALTASGAAWTDDELCGSLFHGTLREHADSIRRRGLAPEVGDWVDGAYWEHVDAGAVEPLVFACGPERISIAWRAIDHHVARKLGKAAATRGDIARHGALVVIEAGDRDLFEHLPKGDAAARSRHPHVEPGDWYSDRRVRAAAVLTGPAMLRMLERVEGLRCPPA
jgi:hypothetical protein